MNIDLSNPPYAVKLNDLGFAYSHTDREEGIIVYTHADPRLVGSKWVDHWDDVECLTLPWLKPRDSCELGLLGFRRYA